MKMLKTLELCVELPDREPPPKQNRGGTPLNTNDGFHQTKKLNLAVRSRFPDAILNVGPKDHTKSDLERSFFRVESQDCYAQM